MRFVPFVLMVVVSSLGFLKTTSAQNGSQPDLPSTNSLSAEQLFESDHIVDVQIELPPESWDTIRFQSRDFVSSLNKEEPQSPFEYVKGNITIDGVLIENVGIRKKGFIGSLDSTRPSLKIKFDEYVDQDPIDGLDRLTLNNNKQDPARYSQYLSYKLFRDSGTVAPRCNFAKVTVNGDYLGIFSNVESVRRDMLERGFGDSSGGLWEGTIADFFPDWYRRFENKNKQAKTKHLKKITKILAEDHIDLEKLSEKIDIDAFVRFWAMESLMGFWDGYCSNQNNFFIYRNPENKKMYFIPWGTDSSFSKTTPLPPYRIRPMSVHAKSILCNKLYRIPKIRKQYEETLMAFLDKHWNEDNLLAEIERIENLLKDVVHEDNSGFTRGLKKNRAFVSWRRKAIMGEFEEGPPELLSRERTPIYFKEMGTATVTFEAAWYKKTPKESAGLGEVKLELTIDGEVVELNDVGVFAERSKWPSEDKVKPASIVISGTRVSDGKTLTLGLGVKDSDFQSNSDDEDVEIGGILIIDNAFVDSKGRMTMIGGRVRLSEASTEDGEPVKGSMEISITKMMGGDEVVGAEDEDSPEAKSDEDD